MNETVLVVDDEERIRSSLRGILSDEGFRVLDTGDAAGVMDLIAREHPALVLLDVWMPEHRRDRAAPPHQGRAARRSASS